MGPYKALWGPIRLYGALIPCCLFLFPIPSLSTRCRFVIPLPLCPTPACCSALQLTIHTALYESERCAVGVY